MNANCGMQQQAHPSNLLSFDRWLDDIGKTRATDWGWRQRGWVHAVNIAGRIYVSRDEIALFERRAAAGEFSKVHKAPNRGGELR
ncbi:MAG: hypothetical protein QOD99_424 [Chthoniobacter sp.]|jgi:hypothetical protein|nr:hypothetical protein [Chthoniobacter sp.]